MQSKSVPEVEVNNYPSINYNSELNNKLHIKAKEAMDKLNKLANANSK